MITQNLFSRWILRGICCRQCQDIESIAPEEIRLIWLSPMLIATVRSETRAQPLDSFRGKRNGLNASAYHRHSHGLLAIASHRLFVGRRPTRILDSTWTPMSTPMVRALTPGIYAPIPTFFLPDNEDIGRNHLLPVFFRYLTLRRSFFLYRP